MKLFNSKEFRYVGFSTDGHHFESIDGNEKAFVKECKFYDAQKSEAYICKRTGEFVKTHHSRSRLVPEQY